MITPTVGRIVWVSRPFDSLDITQPEAATVIYVHGDRSVNVKGFNAHGEPFTLLNLDLLQDDDAKPENLPFAVWMPYQKGQAAKTEALDLTVKTLLDAT